MELAFRPRSATEIVDVAVRLYRSHAGPFFTLAVLAAVPTLLLQLLGLFAERGTANGNAGLWEALGVATLVGVPLYLAYTTVLSGAFAALADDAVRTDAPDVAAAVRVGLRRAWACLGALLLFGLAFGAAAVLLFFPALYVASRLATIIPTCVVEDVGPTEAFRRAWARSRGRAWHSFGVIVVSTLILFVPLMAVGLVTQLLGGATPSLAVQVVSTVVQAALSALVQPFFPLATQLLYYDLRVRAEGYDLEQMVRGLDLPAAGARA